LKKLLLLGGLRYLIPVIDTAHELGHHVITCDYLPDNIAHKYSDEYHNINITDKESVLKLAKDRKIDGIMSFAVDPGVLSASYVSEKLGLPGCPYESVKILQNKALFRQFLNDNGFNVPRAKGFKTYESALEYIDNFTFPVFVKPVDSAGSKGVNKVNNKSGLKRAIEDALNHSLKANEFIIEEYIPTNGFSSDSDSFSVNNELVYISFSDQYFDKDAANIYVPSAFSWPSKMHIDHQNELIKELKRLVKLLKLGTSLYNIEVKVSPDNKPYIMEVSPRGGGNRLAEMLKYASGTDLIKQAVLAALGESNEKISMPEYNGFWAEIILHSDKNGIFKGLEIDPTVKKQYLIETDVWVNEGDKVSSFQAANNSLGTIVLRFDNQNELDNIINSVNHWLKIKVE